MTTGAYALGREDGEQVLFLGTLMTLKATAEGTNRGFGLIEQTLPPGFATPLHVHHSEDEAFYLLEGEARFTCGDQTFGATAGSFIFFPRDIPHWFRVGPKSAARLLQFNAPGGLERFFVEAGDPVTRGEAPDVTPDFERMVAVAARYNIEILGRAPGEEAEV